MNKKTIRIGIFSTAIISVLLFILYLPVLIWSPPWGNKGYYLPLDYSIGDDLSCFYLTEQTLNHYCFGDHLVNISDLKSGATPNMWTGSCDGPMNNKGQIFTISVDVSIAEKGRLMAPSLMKGDFVKTNHPLQVWYIKFLEWTN